MAPVDDHVDRLGRIPRGDACCVVVAVALADAESAAIAIQRHTSKVGSIDHMTTERSWRSAGIHTLVRKPCRARGTATGRGCEIVRMLSLVKYPPDGA